MKQPKKQIHQMSDTLRLGVFLALSGGFMDSYSYLYRDHVFANAQTGNILLFGVNLSQGNIHTALEYFWPILAFVVGIVLSDFARYKADEKGTQLHWRQTSVLLEAVILFCVAFVPTTHNALANSLISLACGIQVESFRKIHGNAIATTMCIGNLRSGTQNLCDYLFRKKEDGLKKGLLYYGVILSFVLGAIIGSIAIAHFEGKSILICSGLLFLTFSMMFIERV